MHAYLYRDDIARTYHVRIFRTMALPFRICTPSPTTTPPPIHHTTPLPRKTGATLHTLPTHLPPATVAALRNR